MPQNLIKGLFWVLLVSTVVVFWISLRTTTDALFYTVISIVLWALTYAAHKWLKFEKNKEHQ